MAWAGAGIGIVDTMIGFAHSDVRATYSRLASQANDRETREEFDFPVEYMFKSSPDGNLGELDDPIDVTLVEMDRWGVEKGMIPLYQPGDTGCLALKRHPDRFIPSYNVDPNNPMAAVTQIVHFFEEYGLRAVCFSPQGCAPQVPINDNKAYPIYAKCVELGLPVWVTAGVPGPRVRMDCQRVELIDEVMYDFPDLVLVTRHGCEPWTELAVKLMVKWPGLHFSTSAFAPKYYPQDVIDYANTRGADKIIYAGYYPMGLSLERIITELRAVPFKDDVWPKFLRANALRVLGLDR